MAPPTLRHDVNRGRSATSLSKPARPGILLDRDGTIIVDRGYVGTVDRVELIDGAAEAIARFNRAGFPVALVSNQAGVARGYYTIDDVERVHAHIASELGKHCARIDRYFYCPYHPHGTVDAYARNSEDRKPRPGMAIAAAADLDLDLSSSWVIGDRPEDIALAEAVGAVAVYLGPRPPADTRVRWFRNLAEAATFILKEVAA